MSLVHLPLSGAEERIGGVAADPERLITTLEEISENLNHRDRKLRTKLDRISAAKIRVGGGAANLRDPILGGAGDEPRGLSSERQRRRARPARRAARDRAR